MDLNLSTLHVKRTLFEGPFLPVRSSCHPPIKLALHDQVGLAVRYIGRQIERQACHKILLSRYQQITQKHQSPMGPLPRSTQHGSKDLARTLIAQISNSFYI